MDDTPLDVIDRSAWRSWTVGPSGYIQHAGAADRPPPTGSPSYSGGSELKGV